MKNAFEQKPTMEPPFRSDFIHKPVFHLLLVAVVALVAYSNTFYATFLFDDESSIVSNRVIKDLSGFLSGAGYDYNPRRFIGYLTFALNYQFGGLNVVGYHIFNLAVHITNACLVYALVRLTLRTPFFANAECGVQRAEFKTRNSKLETRNFLPLLAALLFVCHPIQTQAVTYIVQRLASLATMFYLLSLVLYAKTRLLTDSAADQLETRNSKLETSARFPTRSRALVTLLLYAGSLISAVLAMKTKEIAVTLPVMVLLYEIFFFRGKAARRLLFLLPILLTVFIIPLSMTGSGKAAGELLSDLGEKMRAETLLSRSDYLLTQFRVIVTYIRLLFLPVNQNLDYDYPVYHTLFTPPVFLSFLFLAALFGLAVYLFFRSTRLRAVALQRAGVFNVRCSTFETHNSKLETRNSKPAALRLIAFGILWFFITLTVESSVVPIADVIFEHRLYLPSVGAFISFAGACAVCASRYSAKALFISLALIIAVFSIAAWKRNLVWADSVTLWSDVITKSPAKARPYNELGKFLLENGKPLEAIEYHKKALSLDPAFVMAFNNLGVAYHKVGLMDKAVEQYQQALKLQSDNVEIHNNLGAAYDQMGLLDMAIEKYEKSLTLKADNAEVRNNLGIAYGKKGLIDRAIEEFESVVKTMPDYESAHNNLAHAYALKGWADKAKEQRRIAGELMERNRK